MILAVCLERWHACTLTLWLLHTIPVAVAFFHAPLCFGRVIATLVSERAFPVLREEEVAIQVVPQGKMDKEVFQPLLPRISARCAEVLVLLCHQSIRWFAYLDELLLAADSREQAVLQTHALVFHLRALGFQINLKRGCYISISV